MKSKQCPNCGAVITLNIPAQINCPLCGKNLWTDVKVGGDFTRDKELQSAKKDTQ